MKGRHKNNQSLIPKITEATTYQEAVQVLNVRRAPSIFKRTLDLVFKIDTKTPAGRTYHGQMLQEMENDLKKHEEEEENHAMKEAEHDNDNDNNNNNDEKKKPPFGETEGNPSSGPEHPKEYSIADKTGTTAQSDGGSVEEMHNKAEDTGEGSQPAQAQPGESQLKEAVDQVADMGTVDPRATSVIDYMSDGMSQVQASNAAAADEKMMEAVFDQKFKKLALPILRAVLADYNKLQEIIRTVDKKHEQKKPETGFSESVQIQLGDSSKPEKKMNRWSETSPEEIRNNIKDKYLNDMYS